MYIRIFFIELLFKEMCLQMSWGFQWRKKKKVLIQNLWKFLLYSQNEILGCYNPGPRLNRINRVSIPTRCIFFFGSLSRKNLQVKRAWLGAIWDRWPIGKFSRVRMSEDKVRTKDSCWAVGTIYDSRELPKYRRSRIGRGVTSGIRADSRGFTGVCRLGVQYMAHGACGPRVVTWHGIWRHQTHRRG
jgi:hypothetical protein